MYSIEFDISSLQESQKLGELLGKLAIAGDIICLEGDLGAGKTTLTQSIAHGLGVSRDEYVSSPSFAILHEYQAPVPLFHMDLYRLSGADEVIDLGFEEYFYGEGLCVIEWPSRAYEIIPTDHLQIAIHHRGEETRRVTFSCQKESKWQERVKMMLAQLSAK